jgi:hypothetical protein
MFDQELGVKNNLSACPIWFVGAALNLEPNTRHTSSGARAWAWWRTVGARARACRRMVVAQCVHMDGCAWRRMVVGGAVRAYGWLQQPCAAATELHRHHVPSATARVRVRDRAAMRHLAHACSGATMCRSTWTLHPTRRERESVQTVVSKKS